ncbi:UNVERIFIED_ORG: transposase [Burkholderia sp. 1263]
MFFEELSDEEWSLIGPMLADPVVRMTKRGRPRVQPRVVTNAVLWILTTGESWSKLPEKYPSQPTCRYRFEQWRLNGKLAEMMRVLSHAGRHFSYVPDRPPSDKKADQKPAVAPLDDAGADDDVGTPDVVWKSQESWLSTSTERTAYHADSWILGDIGRTRDTEPGPPEACNDDARAQEEASSKRQRVYAQGAWRTASEASGTSVVNERGYVVHAAADLMQNDLFRGWAEIMENGQRVAHSGLVGPRFIAPEAARQCALDWARDWIDKQEDAANSSRYATRPRATLRRG